MANQNLVALSLVTLVALIGLYGALGQDATGQAMNPHIGCDGHWTYVYGVDDAGGLRCVEKDSPGVGSSYAGGGELGTWPENQNIRRKSTERGFTKQEIDYFKRQANIAEDTYQ